MNSSIVFLKPYIKYIKTLFTSVTFSCTCLHWICRKWKMHIIFIIQTIYQTKLDYSKFIRKSITEKSYQYKIHATFNFSISSAVVFYHTKPTEYEIGLKLVNRFDKTLIIITWLACAKSRERSPVTDILTRYFNTTICFRLCCINEIVDLSNTSKTFTVD